jgi:hypothetical protein
MFQGKLRFGQPKRVPWINHDEWDEVYKMVYHNSPDTRRTGLERIKVWSVRGSLPVSVEATLSLRETYDLDLYFNTGKPRISDKSLREMYTTAFIRFVNGVLDAYQTSVFAKSVAKIAEEISFPRLFVDIRHDGTHNQLPSLDLLRSAAEKALEWLQKNYWDLQTDFIENLREICKELLGSYKSNMKRLARMKNDHDNETMEKEKRKSLRIEMNSVHKEVATLLNQLTEFLPCFQEVVVPCLLGNGNLVSKDKRKRAGDDLNSEAIELWKPFFDKFKAAMGDLGEAILNVLCSIDEDNFVLENSYHHPLLEMLEDKNSQSYYHNLMLWCLYLFREYKTSIDVLGYCVRKCNRYTASIALVHLKGDNSEMAQYFENYLEAIGVKVSKTCTKSVEPFKVLKPEIRPAIGSNSALDFAYEIKAVDIVDLKEADVEFTLILQRFTEKEDPVKRKRESSFQVANKISRMVENCEFELF